MGSRPPTVLVTGATGFVGSALVHALLQRGGLRVRAFGRNEVALRELCAAGAEPVRADLRDPAAVRAACEGAALVYHVGALSAPWGPREEFEAVNVGGTLSVVDACRACGVGRLVYVSSPSVIFDGRPYHEVPDDAPYARQFVSIYSETKKRAEDVVNAARADVPSVIVRPKAVYGPGDTSLLPRLLAAARAGRLPQVGAGRNVVDLTYVDNVVHALVLAGEAPGAVGNTYTVTDGEPPPPLWDVVRHILTGLGLPSRLRRLPLPIALAAASLMEARARRTGREPLLTRYSVLILARTQTHDISGARRDLGYTPVVTQAEGIARTVAAFRRGAA